MTPTNNRPNPLAFGPCIHYRLDRYRRRAGTGTGGHCMPCWKQKKKQRLHNRLEVEYSAAQVAKGPSKYNSTHCSLRVTDSQ